MKRRLILISTLEADLAFASHISQHHHIELVHCAHNMELSKVSPNRDDVLILDANSEAVCSEFERIAGDIHPNLIHYLCSSVQDICRSSYLIGSRLPGHWIRRPTQQILQASHHYGRVLRSSWEQTNGLNSLISPGISIEKLELSQSIQKDFVAESVRGFLEDCKCNSRSSNMITNAVDELMMNALYNAPVDAEGKKRFGPILPTSENLLLEGLDQIAVEIAHEDPYILISVKDLYGSLKRDVLLEHVGRSFNGYQHRGIQDPGSRAGLGLALIFRSGGSYHFSIDPGQRTTVSIFFDISGNFRDAREKFQFLSTQIS